MSVDLERQLREFWIETSADLPELDAEDIALRTFGGTDEANQVALIPAIHRRRGWLVAAAVATVVVAVGLIAVILNPSNELAPAGTPDSVPPEPVVTVPDSAPPEMVPFDSVEWPGLTDDIPEGVESGLVTTPTGAARWVHLTSSEYTLPGVGDFGIFRDVRYPDQNGFWSISEVQFGDWESDDGIEWRHEESSIVLGIDVGGAESKWVPYVDASYSLVWAINENPLEIWTFDYANSGEVDLSGLVPPESDGFNWNLDISTPLSRYRPETTQHVLHVGFSGPDGQVDQRLLVLGGEKYGDSATYVEVPWDVSSSVTLFGTSETLFAFVRDPDSNQISIWRSEDGYRWAESGLLHAQLGVPSTVNLQITVLPALVVPDNETGRPIRNQMVVVTTLGDGWESTNGVDWIPAPEEIPDGTYPIRLESGWFASDGGLWWMHVGGSWVSLAELGMERIGDDCQIIPRASGQTTLFFGTTCAPDSSQGHPAELWIISLDS